MFGSGRFVADMMIMLDENQGFDSVDLFFKMASLQFQYHDY